MALELPHHFPAFRRHQLHRPPPACYALCSLRVSLEQVESRAHDLNLRASSQALLERLDAIRVGLLEHQWLAHRQEPLRYTPEYSSCFTIRPEEIATHGRRAGRTRAGPVPLGSTYQLNSIGWTLTRARPLRSRPAWREITRGAARAGTDGRGREHPGVRERHHTPAVRAHAPASVPGALDPTPYHEDHLDRLPALRRFHELEGCGRQRGIGTHGLSATRSPSRVAMHKRP